MLIITVIEALEESMLIVAPVARCEYPSPTQLILLLSTAVFMRPLSESELLEVFRDLFDPILLPHVSSPLFAWHIIFVSVSRRSDLVLVLLTVREMTLIFHI